MGGMGALLLTDCVRIAHAQSKTPSAIRILVVGDSLSAEYGLRRRSGWVALLAEKLSTPYPQAEIINASVSGDTTSGGRSRLIALLTRHTPQIVLIELGGNDALRGLALASSQENLSQMIEQCQQTGAKVIVVGMQIPPNYGREYATAFQNMFSTLSQEKRTALVPFLLEGLEPQAQMFQADGIHPNETAQPIMMETVLKTLLPVIKGL